MKESIIKNKKYFRVGLLICLFILSGCEASTPGKAYKPTGSPPPISYTGTPSVTLVFTQTKTPTLTSSIINTASATVTIPPTLIWTLLPTLSPDDAEKNVIELLSTNGNCYFPCWWGITPGKTTKIETIEFLSSFTQLMTSWGPPGQEKVSQLEQGSIVGNIVSFYSINGKNDSVDFTFLDGVVDTIAPYHGRRVNTYQLSRILSDYGKPDKLIVSGAPTAPGGPDFFVYLLYESKGIYVEYYYNNVQESGKDMVICPQNIGPEYLLLWSPDSVHRTIQELNPGIAGSPSLTTALGYDLDSFYSIFKIPSSSACMKSPIEIWTHNSTPTTS